MPAGGITAPTFEAAQREAQSIVEDAKTKAELIVKEAELKAKDLLVEVRAQAEREVRDQHREAPARRELAGVDASIDKRGKCSSGARATSTGPRPEPPHQRESLATTRLQAPGTDEAARVKLEAVAGLTREEARRQVVERDDGAGAP